MMKKRLTAFLTAVMLLSLMAPASLAAGSTVTLKEEYLFAGRNGNWYTEEAYCSSPVVTDLEGDGTLEVLNAAYSLVVMDAATGEEKWRVNAGHDRSTEYTTFGNTARQVFTDFEVLDIDADGRKEIVIVYGNGTVSVLNDQGYFESGWPQKPTDAELRSLAVDDLDLDGKLEIIVGAGIANATSVWAYYSNGTLISGWPQLDQSKNAARVGTNKTGITGTAYSYGVFGDGITTGDLTGDGRPEVIVPTDMAYINAYEMDGSLVTASPIYKGRAWGKIALYEDFDQEVACVNEGWGYAIRGNETRAELYRAELGHSAAVYTDVDGDGTGEVVVTALMIDRTGHTNTNVVTVADTRYMTAFILNQDRTRYVNKKLGFDWTTPPVDLGGPLKNYDDVSMVTGVFSEPVCADVDGDGYQEIIFNTYNGKVHCFKLDGTEYGSWPFTLPKTGGTVYEYASVPTTADLDGDGKREVIFASWTDSPSGADSKVNGALYVLSSDGKLLDSIDLHDGYASYEGVVSHSNGVKGSPVVADIDKDGKQEILLNTSYYALCAYEVAVTGGTPVEQPSSWAKAEVNTAISAGLVPTSLQSKYTTPITRAEFCALANALYENVKGEVSGRKTFNDTTDINVEKMAYVGVVNGVGDGTAFAPDDKLTREQAATMLARLANAVGKPLTASAPGFTDNGSIGNWAYDSVGQVKAAGVMNGTGDGSTFSPKDDYTREQSILTMVRMLEVVK